MPTNQMTVTLSNVAPNPVTIISPSDGTELDITPDNLEEEIAVIWTAASDDDNDPLEYFMSLADRYRNLGTASRQCGYER